MAWTVDGWVEDTPATTIRPDYFGGMRDFLSTAAAPTTGFVSEENERARWRQAIAGARRAREEALTDEQRALAGGMTVTPFMEQYLRNQFDPLYDAWRVMTPALAQGAEGAFSSPVGFVESVRSGAMDPFMYRSQDPEATETLSGRATLQKRLREIQALLAAGDPVGAAEGSADRVTYDRYYANPVEQFNAALAGATAGVHPLYRSGTVAALRRLYDQMGGDEMTTPFLRAAQAAGYLGSMPAATNGNGNGTA